MKDIEALSFSNYSNEFLIHVPSDYYYRLASSKQRIPFVATVVKAKLTMTSDFRIYYRNATYLTSWARTETNKNNVNKVKDAHFEVN